MTRLNRRRRARTCQSPHSRPTWCFLPEARVMGAEHAQAFIPRAEPNPSRSTPIAASTRAPSCAPRPKAEDHLGRPGAAGKPPPPPPRGRPRPRPAASSCPRSASGCAPARRATIGHPEPEEEDDRTGERSIPVAVGDGVRPAALSRGVSGTTPRSRAWNRPRPAAAGRRRAGRLWPVGAGCRRWSDPSETAPGPEP